MAKTASSVDEGQTRSSKVVQSLASDTAPLNLHDRVLVTIKIGQVVLPHKVPSKWRLTSGCAPPGTARVRVKRVQRVAGQAAPRYCRCVASSPTKSQGVDTCIALQHRPCTHIASVKAAGCSSVRVATCPPWRSIKTEIPAHRLRSMAPGLGPHSIPCHQFKVFISPQQRHGSRLQLLQCVSGFKTCSVPCNFVARFEGFFLLAQIGRGAGIGDTL